MAYAENTNGGVDTIPPLPPLSPSLILSFTLQSNQLESLGSAVSSPSGVRGEAPAENEFGALYRCQKATGGNHFEYSEVHVLQ